MALFHIDTFKAEPRLLNGNLQIIACAGSGKTEFVSERIAFQIYNKIAKPDEIVAFTFTEKAAEELKFRIRSKIKQLIGKQPDVGDMYIGTIHSFAFKLLQEFVPKYRAFDVLDEITQLAFISSIKFDINSNHLFESLNERFKYNFYKHGLKENWVFRNFVRDVNILREEGKDCDSGISDSFKKAYDTYISKLNDKRFLDFSGILRLTVDILSTDKSILDKVKTQYKFFTVDEYQDVNPIQEKLIQLISNKKNVCVVGDDDQSIYQWRGADVNNIITFKKRYSNVFTHELLINRRSQNIIVHSASALINSNKTRIKKSIKDNGIASDPGDLYKIIFERQEQEIEWIVNKIKDLVGKEYKDGNITRQINYNDIALIFRSIKFEAKHYIEALSNAGIPTVFTGVGGLFETPEVNFIMSLFEYICVFDKDVVYDDNFLIEITSNVTDIIKVDYLILKLFLHKTRLQLSKSNRISLHDVFFKILSFLQLSNDNYHDSDEVLLYNLGRLSQAISDYENSREYLTYNNIKDFLWFIKLHAENSYDQGITDSMADLVDAVQILTMHGTKGLGFPVVFIPSNFKKNHRNVDFGPTFIDTSKVNLDRFLNKIDDDRRLFYVALTRAKKFLFVTTAEYKVGASKRSSNNFLFDELDEKYFLNKPINDPTIRANCDFRFLDSEKKFPTNYSELAYYLSCGYDYKIRFIFGFNPGIVPALGFGKQVHNIINLLHKSYEDNKVLPNKKTIANLLDNHFYLRYASDEVQENLKQGAYSSLIKYVNMWSNDFSMAIKTERNFEMEWDNALISGSIDMIKRHESDQNVLEVIDFKTGKPVNDREEKYTLQVQLYTIAARDAIGINIKKALVHYLDENKNERVEIPTSDYALETAAEQISYAIKGVTSNVFKRDARKNSICKNCDWNKICPKRNGYDTRS